MNNPEIPPDATQVTTEDLLAIIGELLVQNRTLQRMIRDFHATKGSEIQNGYHEERQEGPTSIQRQQSH